MGTEEGLVSRLAHTVRQARRVALVLGSGICVPVIPGVRGMISLAEAFAAEAIGNPDLAAALAAARTQTADRPAETYAAYRRTFTEWVSPTEFDIVVQHAVLSAYRPSDGTARVWERIGFQRGMALEKHLDAWRLPEGVAALGVLLTNLAECFGYRVLTTNFDPLIEIAVNRAGGQARSISLHRDGSLNELVAAPGQVDVVHLHGYWRPTRQGDQRASSHDPEQLRARRPTLSRELADLLRDETVCVVGYSGWDDVFTQALFDLHTAQDVDVLWAMHGGDDEPGTAPPRSRDGTLGVPVYYRVDSNRLFVKLQRVLLPALPRQLSPPDLPGQPGLPRPRRPTVPGAGASTHRYRLPALERLLGARLNADELLRALDHEFGWRVDRTPGTPLEVLFWPVQLRAPTLIYAVQALVAAALSTSGIEVVLAFDDLAAAGQASDLRRNFTVAVRRWFALIENARPPRTVSLLEFCDPGFVAQRVQDPELADRPIHPWAVEREYYASGHTVYDILRAARVVPDAEATEAVLSEVQLGLTTTDAIRLISAPAIWSYLHYLMRRHPPQSVLTLGGEDEAIIWRSWHEAFLEPVNHLYHPRMVNVRQDAARLGRRTFRELVDGLSTAVDLPGWDQEGRYLPWTVQNAVLLARYLGVRPHPSTPAGILESWPTVVSALRTDQTRRDAIRAVAREVSALMT